MSVTTACAQPKVMILRTLHMENAQVSSMAYLSATKPILQQTFVREGKTYLSVSHDNGRTWSPPQIEAWEQKLEKTIATHDQREIYVDAARGVVIDFRRRIESWADQNYDFGPDMQGDLPQLRTGRIFYRFSRDDGETWTPFKQLVHAADGYDKTNWAPGITYGRNTAYVYQPMRLDDNTVLLPISFGVRNADGELARRTDRFGERIWPAEGVATFRGTWRADGNDLDWTMSNRIEPEEHLTFDLAEPAVAAVDDGKLLMVMRGSATARQTMSGVKWLSISRDGGRTWSQIVPLTYPDGPLLNSPASLPNLFRAKKNNKLYLITNIIDRPVRQSDPRFPLQLIEIHPQYLWALRDTVTIIADREAHHPELVRFSNWVRITDRETGNPVIFMTEARADSIVPYRSGKTSPHAWRYEIVLPN